jgi:gamma-glutamylcyclotransferase (GGCT)/AIG2-like uncharacterized protein YtfP
MQGEANGKRVFVYGTLRRGFRLHRHLKKMNALYLGTGSVRAKLYDLGDYPGAIRSRLPKDRITGELYELSEPVEQLKKLDMIEEFYPSEPSKSLFVRRSVTVRLEDGSQSRAWIYLLNRKPQDAPVVRRGDYLLANRSNGHAKARRP